MVQSSLSSVFLLWVLFLGLSRVALSTPSAAATATLSGRSFVQPRSALLSRRRSRSPPLRQSCSDEAPLAFLDHDEVDDDSITTTRLCSGPGVAQTLARGAMLRIASDLSGGTVLESIKTRVTVSLDGPVTATRKIVDEGGVLALWTGTPSRTVEGALIGALFMLGSVVTKKQCLKLGAPATVAALAGGVVGGVAQSLAMTPAGMIFTSLHSNKGRKGFENDNALTAARRVIREKGFFGMYAGNTPMVLRQASNWASRAGFTEVARSTLGLSQYGLAGEVLSGAIGGVGSCWNTPIETIRVVMQRDISQGKEAKTMGEYWNGIRDEQGYPGLFRGVTPRGLQAIWQTLFLVVVPNLLGI